MHVHVNIVGNLCEVGRNNLNHRNQVGTNLKPVCAWKSLEMDFRLFLWVVLFLDVV